MSEPIGISLLGAGTVASGAIQLLREGRENLLNRTSLAFDLRHVGVRDLSKLRKLPVDTPLSTDLHRAIDDPKVSIVVELIGGTTTADALVRRALEAGKHVVTANKSLLAAKGPELFALAKKRGVCIAFEASCGGGIPLIDSLTRGLLANRIDALTGIVNGTCNAILTRMTQNGWAYPTALKEAQELGFAEADPAMDVSGRDAAQKLAILASLAFGVAVRESDIYVEGIDQLAAPEIQFAAELGYVIKLLAIGQRAGDKIVLRVHPTFVHKDDVLADVSGGFNAVSVYGHAVGHTLFFGRGAGASPTASAVIADLIDVALGSYPARFAKLNIFPDSLPPAAVQPIEQLVCRHYVRLMVRDVPGTIARISEVFGRHAISLSAILQREDSSGNVVPLVVTTHHAAEGAMRAALKEIDMLDCAAPPSVRLRIIDAPKEFANHSL